MNSEIVPSPHVDIFTFIYSTKLWGDDGNQSYMGSSGNGSLPRKNIEYINFIRKFIIDHAIESIVDVGCGTFQLGPFIFADELASIRYTGYDAYRKLIDSHIKTYNDRVNFTFIHLDACHNPDKLQSADLCIIKDVLQHWTLSEIYSFLDSITNSKKFKHILICNQYGQDRDDLDNDNVHRSHGLSANFLPLKKYKPEILLHYEDKEVCLIHGS